MPQSCSIVIASTNRPLILQETLASVLSQSLQPVEIVLCTVKEEDFPFKELLSEKVRHVLSKPSSAQQRNFGFKSLQQKTDFVTFLDDDIILHKHYLMKLAETFSEKASCVCIMGHLLANGKITLEEAKALCESPPDLGDLTDKYFATSHAWGGLYGCNMSFRWDFLEKEQFDERLPLYSEMEDVDMGTRARRYGEVGYSYGSLAVHLQASSGRINHRMQGFSQIMNPYYLSQKGTIPKKYAVWNFIVKRPLQNLLLGFIPEQRNKRLQRLQGNLYAIKNILSGRIEPELILNLTEKD